MGIFDKVKKILFDEEEIEDLPVREDKKDEENEMKRSSGVIIHNEVDEDTITEVKVPEEKPTSLRFPVQDSSFEDEDEKEINDIQSRLNEVEMNRTQEIERVRETNLSRSERDIINEYKEERREERRTVEPRRETVNIPEKKETGPYKVPPVISPVFGVLDKNYDPDNYEETRQKITMSNSGNTSQLGERQFGPVSFNDQGIPKPKYQKETIIITTNSPDILQEELKKENELIKETAKIEEEIINNIINDTIEDNSLDDTEDITKDIEEIKEETVEPFVSQEVDEPTIDFEEEVDEDAVISGSPYDDMLDAIDEEKEPTVDINELISQSEEADVTPDAPEDIEENVNLDDTIETDLYNLIDSMYKDEE